MNSRRRRGGLNPSARQASRLWRSGHSHSSSRPTTAGAAIFQASRASRDEEQQGRSRRAWDASGPERLVAPPATDQTTATLIPALPVLTFR